jgi:tryptophan synthase alpha chain
MNRIRETFNKIKSQNRSGLVTFVTAGVPNLKTSLLVVKELIDAGSDVVEIGMPFSDPLAEGPVIQRSSFTALQNGVNIDHCLSIVKKVRINNKLTPLVLMGYYNPVYQYGVANFLKNCAESEVDGLIIVDLPAAEADSFKDECNNTGISFIPLIAPTSTDINIEKSIDKCDGFVYCVSVTGVTGARNDVSKRGLELVDRIKKYTDLPIAVGFGVSTRKHVNEICETADAAVVGSALISVMLESTPEKVSSDAGAFVRSLVDNN